MNSWLLATKTLRSSESCKGKQVTRSHKSKKRSGHEICNRLSWFSTEKDKMHLHSTHVIRELEHEHRTGFSFHCVTTNNAVFTSGTTDSVNQSIVGYFRICAATRFLSGRLVKMLMTANLNYTIYDSVLASV